MWKSRAARDKNGVHQRSWKGDHCLRRCIDVREQQTARKTCRRAKRQYRLRQLDGMQGPHAAVDQTDVCQKRSRGGHGSGHFVGKAYAASPPAFETGRTCCRVMLCPLPWQVYHAEVGEDVDDEELLASFRSFASFGAGAASSLHAVGGRAVEMDGPRFAKLCRETGLQAGHLSSVGIDIIFSQVKAKVRPPPLPPPPVVTTLSSAVAVVRGERLLFLVSDSPRRISVS